MCCNSSVNRGEGLRRGDVQGVAKGASGSVVNRRTGAFIMQESGRSFGGQGQTLDTQIRFPRIVGGCGAFGWSLPVHFTSGGRVPTPRRPGRCPWPRRPGTAGGSRLRRHGGPRFCKPPHSSTPLPVPSVSGPVSARDPNVKNLSRCPPRPTTTTLTTPPSASASGFRIGFRSFTRPQGSPSMIWLVRAVGFERGAFAR